jgi:histidyl-tRNA synthetase
MALSTQPYKGARDFYPEDKRVQKYMFSTWRKVAERYGYEEYDAPILEPTDLYLAKGNQEIIDTQTYSFQDRGQRNITIRTEMTPTVSRMVAGRRQELSYPLRWYSVPNLWRYERPQRGRLREFWQLNVDVFGVDDISAEFEMLQVISDMFSAFGATANMYEISLNHRGLINFLLQDYLHLEIAAQRTVAGLIDRMHKMERSKFISAVDDALTASQREANVTEQLLTILDAKTINELPELAQKQPAVQELKQLILMLKDAGIVNAKFDSTLMRGFDYYTGIVFEVTDTDPENNRAVLGGGRYDGLVALFGVTPVAAVGFAWGDVPLQNFLESHRLMPALGSEAQVFAAILIPGNPMAYTVIAQLRAMDINVAVGMPGRKLGDQFKAAEKKGIANVLIIGEAELQSGQFKLKNLASGQEQISSISDIATTLHDRD